jgi:CheY-specific phosphatase CheX
MIHKGPILDLSALTARAITEVLATQFGLSAVVAAVSIEKPIATQAEPCLVGSVRFSGDRISGVAHLQLPAAFAAKVTALLLGQSIVDDDEAEDMTGELCNMLAGRVAAGLAADGYPSILSIPAVSRDGQFELETVPGNETCRSDWTCEGYLLTVMLQVIVRSI